MLNSIAKFLLVGTSLSPVLGAVAVSQISNGARWTSWLPWLVAGLLLVLLCWGLLRYASVSPQTQRVYVREFERNDVEVLTFLLAYLLPFVSSEDMAFTENWLVGAYIYAVIFMVLAHAGAYHFNPVMSMLKYHFYSIRNRDGVSQLLISKRELRKPGIEIETVRLAHGIYLQIGDCDAQ